MPSYAYFQGKIIPLEDAKLPVTTHAFHYGTACFEGIRGNYNPEEKEVYLFRALDHYERLTRSAHIIKIKIRHSPQQLLDITLDVLRKSGLKEDTYVRPVAYKSQQAVANLRAHLLEDDVMIFSMPMGNYLDPNKGIHCATSSWRRVDDLSIPARAKITGMYVNSVMAKTEAVESGFDEAIMLTHDGHVSEGSAENIFMVAGGKLITPPPSDNILVGITRDTVMTLAQKELGIQTVERSIDRSELYTADEVFLTGTAAHLTPVTKMDHRQIGDGNIGSLTKKLQSIYFDVVRGQNKKYISWCTPVHIS